MTLDAASLLESRLLIQANSGGGKSGLLRKIAEQTVGRLQTIVIDWEGEFSTLREVGDVLLVGPDGDLAATVKSAGKLGRKLVEQNVSAVIDVSELSLVDRRSYAASFVSAVMTSPKTLWHPMLVGVDEAQEFCPEGKPCASSAAVISLLCQGRKRGIGSVLCTQRLSRLSKDAAAECNNVCIGRTTLVIDQRSAGDALGLPGKADRSALKDLNPREFWGYGPAFNYRGAERLTVGKTRTQRPPLGARATFSAPAAGAKVKALIPGLSEAIGAEGGEPLDMESALARIRELETAAKQRAPTAAVKTEDTETVKALRARVHALEGAADKSARTIAHDLTEAVTEAVQKCRADVVGVLEGQRANVKTAIESLRQLDVGLRLPDSFSTNAHYGVRRMEAEKAIRSKLMGETKDQGGQDYRKGQGQGGTQRHRGHGEVQAPVVRANAVAVVNGELGSGMKSRIFYWCARLHPESVSKRKLALLAQVSHTSGSYSNALGALRSQGLIEYPSSSTAVATASGMELAATLDIPPMPAGDELVDVWRGLVGGGMKRTILDVFVATPSAALTNAELGERTGLTSTSGSFSNALGSLRTLGILAKGQPVRLTAEFLEAAGLG